MEKNETFEITFIQYDTLKKMIANLESELTKYKELHNVRAGSHNKCTEMLNLAWEELKELRKEKTCRTCKHKNICLMAQKSKDSLGTKLYEQWFSCYESE